MRGNILPLAGLIFCCLASVLLAVWVAPALTAAISAIGPYLVLGASSFAVFAFARAAIRSARS